MNIEVRPACAADAPAIARIHVDTWRAAYRGQMPDSILDRLDIGRRQVFWQERLTEPRGHVFVSEVDSEIIGFCDLIPTRDHDADSKSVAEIAAIYVFPDFWRKGVGRVLCTRALAEARAENHWVVTLWVLTSHGAARGFYEALGFEADGATKIDETPDGDIHQVRYRITL